MSPEATAFAAIRVVAIPTPKPIRVEIFITSPPDDSLCGGEGFILAMLWKIDAKIPSSAKCAHD